MSRKYEYGAQRRQGPEIMWGCPLAGRETAHPQERAPSGQPEQPTSTRACADLIPVSGPDAGHEKLRVDFRGFLSHHLGDEEKQNCKI